MGPMDGMPPPSFSASSFGVPPPFEPSERIQDAYLEDHGVYTGTGPIPPTVPAIRVHTEVIPGAIPNSSFSTLAGALGPIDERPRHICTAAFSSLMGAVDPIRGPWRELAREIPEAPCESMSCVLAEVPLQVHVHEPIGEPVPVPELVTPPIPQAPVEDVEEGPRQKRVRVVNGNKEKREREGQRGREGGRGRKETREIARRQRRAPIEGCAKFFGRKSQDYVARRRETVGARGQVPVVRPQVHGSALQGTNNKSTTSIYRVENPTGEPVPEAVPQSFGGLSTAAPGEEEENARKRKSADPHVCDECNMWLSCPSDMARHKASRDHGNPAKFKCDDCRAPFFRKDAVHRHKKDHCMYRHRRNGDEHGDDGRDGPLQDPGRDGPEGGGGGMEPMGGRMFSWQS